MMLQVLMLLLDVVAQVLLPVKVEAHWQHWSTALNLEGD
jgi:hypothetical protein